MICSRSFADIAVQRAISSSVRPHPRHWPLRSNSHLLMQGEGMSVGMDIPEAQKVAESVQEENSNILKADPGKTKSNQGAGAMRNISFFRLSRQSRCDRLSESKTILNGETHREYL